MPGIYPPTNLEVHTQAAVADPPAWNTFTFSAQTVFVSIEGWDQAMMIQLTHDGTNYKDSMEVDPEKSSMDLVFACRGFRVQNKVAGDTARAEIRGSW